MVCRRALRVAFLAVFVVLSCGLSAGAGVIDISRLVEAASCSTDLCAVDRVLLEAVLEEFPLSEDAALEALGKAFPDVPQDTHKWWLGDECEMVLFPDGDVRYFREIAHNTATRHLEYVRKQLREQNAGSPFYDQVRDIVFRPKESGRPASMLQPYINRHSWLVEHAATLPRSLFPEDGLLRFWVPVAIDTACQDGARMIECRAVVSGEAKKVVKLSDDVSGDFRPVPFAEELPLDFYLRRLPQADDDIGLIYCEFPLGKLSGDLSLSIRYTFSHYEQRFVMDPARVGWYDVESSTFWRYTAPGPNTALTPGITELAKRIAAGDTNPLRVSKKIYDYIVDRIRYSYMPHETLAVMQIPESEYVLENRYGDCGAQSMFFAALCRSLGIPARTTGGYQLVPGLEGPHFWAEVYLPAYGWVPVDPTVAEAADWSDAISEADRRTYKDYFFGNQDPYRLVIQRDVDVALRPAADEAVLMSGRNGIPMAVQFPQALVDPYDGMTTLDIMDHWKTTFTPID